MGDALNIHYQQNQRKMAQAHNGLWCRRINVHAIHNARINFHGVFVDGYLWGGKGYIMTIPEIKALNPYIIPGLMYKDIDPIDYAEMIIAHVGRKFHLSVSDMKRNTRKRHIVKPRQIAMYLIYDKLFGKLSLKQIGEIFGGKDHTTVIFAIQTIKGRMQVDSDFMAMVNELKK